MKKGMTLSFETVVIAVIVLVVLLVTIGLVTGTLQKILPPLSDALSCEKGFKGQCETKPADGKSDKRCFVTDDCKGAKWCCT